MEFSENDPFAELTRIMGHDPRVREPAEQAAPASARTVAATPVAAPAEDDFDIDLERELAGEFDFAEFEDQATVADWRSEPAAAEPAMEAARHEPAGEEPVSLDAEFEEFFRESDAAAAQAHAPAAGYAAPSAEPVYDEPVYDEPASVAGMEDDLEDALERELFAGHSFEPEAEPAGADSHAAYEAPVSDDASSYDASSYAERAYDEPAYDEPAYRAAGPDAAQELVADDASAEADDAWTTEAEFDLDFLEKELAAASAPAAPAATVASPYAAEQFEHDPEPEAALPEPSFGFDEPVAAAAAEPVSAELSLEDELHRLLADDAPPAAMPVAAVSVGAAMAAPFPAAAAPSARIDHPAVNAFGRANFPAPQPAAAPAAAVAYRPEPAQSDAPASTVRTAAPVYVPADEPVFEKAQASHVPGDDLDDIFGDDFMDGLDGQPQQAAQSLPDVETVEVVETVQPVADDLDIPDVDYTAPGEASQRAYDDLDADFANVFGDLGMEQPQQSQPAAAAPAAPAQPSHAQAFALDDMQWNASQPFADTDLDYENDLDQALSMAAYDDEEAQPAPRRRGMLIAAVVAGVALLGGAGVLGMSMFGGGSDTPAVVRADSEPMKVRPENPGGTTVPNQDNEVYQRVTGGASNAAPEQERLITTAEEPVDMAARTAAPEEAPVLAPGIDDEAGLLPKSEDRIEPETEATSPVTAGETAAVAPRRVRTMVVRPDGTMVPREDPAPAVAEQPVAAPQQQSAIELQPVAPAPLAANETAAELDDGPTVETPQTVAVIPTQRVEPQAAPSRPAVPAPQPAVQQPAAQAPVAAAPVSAPAAAAPAGATSEWSMQIASQPTAEGAQSTYQDLARRYGNVIEGRGVNIVRADIEGRGTYYRVRIPASSRDEAIQLCTRYKAAGGSCFVSR